MSTIDVTFTTQQTDFEPLDLGTVQLALQINGQTTSLDLRVSKIPSYGRVQIVQYTSQSVSDNQQAANYVDAILRDYRNVLNPNPNAPLLPAFAFGNTVRIIAIEGVFTNWGYSGNAFANVDFDVDNTVQPPPKTFFYSKKNQGDCDNEIYTASSATGGTAPYTLSTDQGELFTGWDGASNQDFNLDRTKTYNGNLIDSDGEVIRSFSEVPTRKLAASDFSIVKTFYPVGNYSDVVIEKLVDRPGTAPLEYSLDGNTWKSENIFGGLTIGSYTLYVRDTYGCAVTKPFLVEEVINPIDTTQRERYFTISEYNPLSFYRSDRHSTLVRKNYENTVSFHEAVQRPKTAWFEFTETESIITKFNSSLPFHIITLHKWDGSKLNVPFSMIQQNLGVTERVDCKVFPIRTELNTISGGTITINNGTGVYFDGGNKYSPNTSTVIDASPYESGLPTWAKVGNVINIQGLGDLEILETDLFDEQRGVTYFRINGTVQEGSAIVQTIFDRHPYNVFRFDIDVDQIYEHGNHLKIEPGYRFDEIEQTLIHRSEPFRILRDASKHIKITWKAFRNLGEMIFLDNAVSQMWIKGRVRPFPDGNAETDDADDRTRSIDQDELLRMRVEIPLMTPKQWRKFGMVGAIGNRGTVTIEDMEVVRLRAIDQEEQGNSNVSKITCEFSYSGEPTTEGQQDPVLDISTGIIGGGGTGKEGVTGWQISGFRLVDEDGQLLQLDGHFVEVD